MTESVGKIGLDLGVNYDGFKREMKGIGPKASGMIGGAFKSLGMIAGVAMGGALVVGFTKGAINMASALEEVQNVVDVTFGNMAGSVNQFSKNALQEFGLSELSAKKFTSTMGAMLKSSGMAGDGVAGMSMEVTKLTADMASFYDLDHQVVFDKIRSGLSGETMPLKQLGINMNVANLEAYALANGIKKSYQEMSQAEQVALRYQYLLSTTADAQGDFARTIDSWANQTRLLSEQFIVMKGIMGEGIITMLTPAIRVLNVLIAKLTTAAKYFTAFINLIYGKKKENPTTKAMGDMSDSAEDASKGIGEVGGASKKAAKEAKSLMGFDEINNMMEETADSASGLAEDLGGAGGGVEFDFEFPEEVEGPDLIAQSVENMLNSIKSTWAKFTGGFTTELNTLKQSFLTLFNNLGEIGKTFIDGFVNTVVSIGKTLGDGFIKAFTPAVQLAMSIVQTVLDSLNEFFEQNMDSIKRVITEGWEVIQVGIETVINIIADLMHEIFGGLLEWWKENSDQVKFTLLNTWNTIWFAIETVWTILYDLAMNIFEGLRIFFERNNSRIAEVFVAVWDMIWITISTIWNVLVLTAKLVFTELKEFWDKWGETILATFTVVWTLIADVFAFALDLLIGTFAVFKKLFQGDWAGAWEESKKIGARLWEDIKVMLSNLWEGIKTMGFTIWTKIEDGVIERWEAIRTGVSDTSEKLVDAIKSPFVKAKEWILEFIEEAYDWGKNLVTGIADGIKSGIGAIKTAASGIASKIGSYVGFQSPTKEGEGAKADKWMPNMIKMMADGITGNIGQIRNAVGSVSAELAQVANPEIAYTSSMKSPKGMDLEDGDFVDKLMGLIATAVATANTQTSSSDNSDQQEVVLEVDGVRLGRVLLPKMNVESGRLGYKPILQYE